MTRNTTHDVYITQLVKPKVVHSVCCHQEVPLGQLFVHLVGRPVQSIEDPFFHKVLVSGGLDEGYDGKRSNTTSYLQSSSRSKILIKFEHGELGGVEDLVTELPVAFYTKDLEVDVATYQSDSQQAASVRVTSGRTSRRVRAERKPQRVASAFGDTIWEILLLASFGFGNLFIVQVALVELFVEGLEVYSLDDVDRVDDISKGFAHLPPVRVSDHCVTVHLLERHLTGQLDAQQHHPCHPEEQNVPPSF